MTEHEMQRIAKEEIEKSKNREFTKQDFINAFKREICLDFLQWMNKVASEHPMALETDSEDIVEMYINKIY